MIAIKIFHEKEMSLRNEDNWKVEFLEEYNSWRRFSGYEILSQHLSSPVDRLRSDRGCVSPVARIGQVAEP